MSQFNQWLLFTEVALLAVIAYTCYSVYRILRCWWQEAKKDEDDFEPLSILASIHKGLEEKYGRKNK